MKFDRIYSLTQRVLASYGNWNNIRENTFEFAACSNAELETMAVDIGLSGADFRALAERGTNAAELLPCRLRLFGLVPEEVRAENPVLYRDMERLCSGCRNKERCKRELNHTFLSWAPYCPNERTMSALIADQEAKLN